MKSIETLSHGFEGTDSGVYMRSLWLHVLLMLHNVHPLTYF